MARSNVDFGRETRARRLRIPTVLAVALVGSSASVAMMIGGCDGQNPEADAGPMMSTVDAKPGETPPDAREPNALTDAGIDSKIADGPRDGRPDVPRDAPPDTPVV